MSFADIKVHTEYLVARHFTEEDLDTLATEVRNESY